MNSSEVRELLSAYFDDELTDADRAEVTQHLLEDSQYEAELAGFQRLSLLAGQLTSPTPPDDGWIQLEQHLGGDVRPVETAATPKGSLKNYRLAAVAVSILVVVGISLLVYRGSRHTDDETLFTAEFNHYLEEFQRDPDAAQEFLLAKYKHWRVDSGRNVERVNYRPVVADGLPNDYAAKDSYVLEMPCCTCVQSLCSRRDGTKLAVFEHDDEETDHWFGDRPKIDVVFNGKKCCLVELGNQLAATWEHENRYISLIGVRDISEVDEFMGWMDDRRR